jgi:hypothetical protein
MAPSAWAIQASCGMVLASARSTSSLWRRASDGAPAGGDVLGHAGHAEHAFAARRIGVVGAADQGDPARAAVGAGQAAFQFQVAMAGEGLQHGAAHAFAFGRIEAGAQLAPGQRRLGRQAEDGGGAFAQQHAVGGRIPAPVAQAAGGERHLQAVIALRRACWSALRWSMSWKYRVSPSGEGWARTRTSASGPGRRIPGPGSRCRPSNGGTPVRAGRRAAPGWRPELLAEHVGCGSCAAAPAFPARAIDIGDAPVVVDRAHAVAQAVEHVFHARLGLAQRVPGRRVAGGGSSRPPGRLGWQLDGGRCL